MFSKLLRGLAPLSLFLAVPVAAQSERPVTAADLMRHIEVLASDEYQGRAPASEGERLTTAYIIEQFRARGLEPAGEDGTWFQPVRLVERFPQRHQVSWTADGRSVEFDAGDILLMGKEASERLDNAPVVFAGHGVRMPDRGIDQLAGADVTGAVVLIVLQAPQVPGFPSLAERTRTLREAGAAAVIAIVGAEVPWEMVVRSLRTGTTRLDSTEVTRISGVIPQAAAERLIAAAGRDFGRLLNDQPGSSFRAVTLPLRASIDVTTAVERFTSNNVLGRIRGSGNSGESLLYLAHWDHLGICRAEGAADRICNGAVDNASGVASLIEIAGRLAAGPRPQRDILFLATTAEEVGLLGAEYFAAHPTVPLSSIVAAINLDTVALHPAGTPVAVLGRGVPALDRVVDETVAAAGRQLDTDNDIAVMLDRQDGWKLAEAGVPAVMVGGSLSDMERLGAFLNGTYHGPEDELGAAIPLDGAAEDSTLLVALGRRLADPAVYRRPEEAQP